VGGSINAGGEPRSAPGVQCYEERVGEEEEELPASGAHASPKIYVTDERWIPLRQTLLGARTQEPLKILDRQRKNTWSAESMMYRGRSPRRRCAKDATTSRLIVITESSRGY
jgi:hypothetical protein